MPLVPLDIPPGFYRNGTAYQSKGRWAEGNLVRWGDGALRPLNGWERTRDTATKAVLNTIITDPANEAIRGAFRWRSLGGKVWTAFGTNLKLYAISQDGLVYDITPADYVEQPADGGYAQFGYGIGPYGAQFYGTERQNAPRPTEQISLWTFTTWGENLIVGMRGNNQKIYEWVPSTPSTVAAPITNAPLHTQGVITTMQRILVSIGDANQERLVTWSDSEDNNDWAPAVSNQAGFQLLGGEGALVSVVAVGESYLIVGERDAVLMTYIGPPYIHSFTLVGQKTSIMSAEALVSIGSSAIWWGDRSFWLYNGNSVQQLDCEVMDYLVEDLDTVFRAKITSHTLTTFNEIWWYYQSKTSPTGENDSYIVYNYKLGIWFTGKQDRAAGVDTSGFVRPWKITTEGYIFTHEIPTLVPSEPAYIISGPLELGQGDKIALVDAIYPDNPVTAFTPLNPGGSLAEDDLPLTRDAPTPGGTVAVIENETTDSPAMTITLIGRDYPNASTDREYGPYTMDHPIKTRARGREIRVRLDMNNAILEHGIARLNIRPGGSR